MVSGVKPVQVQNRSGLALWSLLVVWLLLANGTMTPNLRPEALRAAESAPAAALEWAIEIDSVRCPLFSPQRSGGVTLSEAKPSCLSGLPILSEPIDPAGQLWRASFASQVQAADWVVRLLARPGIRSVEPAVQLRYAWTPQDPLLVQQQWLTVTSFPAAWDDTVGRHDVVVAVIDSGVAAIHPDLAEKLLPGYDFLRRDNDPDDEVGHGTAVAGIIAAAGSNGIGIAGGAMGVQILPLKVGDQSGTSSLLIAEAIYSAVERGASVINLSLGADTPSGTLERAIQEAYQRGVVIVAAAGNTPDSVTYPASYPEVISVGGATADGRRLASFSSRLTRVDLIAPAEDVLTTSWDGQDPGWEPRTGTSFAAPVVTAAVALVRSVAPDASVEWIRQVLRETAQPLDPPGQPGSGGGLLSAGGAVQQAVIRRFAQTWQRADYPVAIGQVERSWIWGPSAFAVTREAYIETRSGTRAVGYFDKARLELTNPDRPPQDPWSVTSGLLARELITGSLQVGDSQFVAMAPATVPVAGDPDDTNGPTYATLAALLAAPPLGADQPIIQRIDRSGLLTEDPNLARYDVRAGPLITETGHRVASVFWDWLQMRGIVYEQGNIQESWLFWPPFAVTGYPITEAYWARVKVRGQQRDVLIQCFERRCLTYTPENPVSWQVELGNVGQHYYRWRYATAPPLSSPANDPVRIAPVDGDGRG